MRSHADAEPDIRCGSRLGYIIIYCFPLIKLVKLYAQAKLENKATSALFLLSISLSSTKAKNHRTVKGNSEKRKPGPLLVTPSKSNPYLVSFKPTQGAETQDYLPTSSPLAPRGPPWFAHP